MTNYEEKYKKALEQAKAGKPIDEVFPELKETEDERIRKTLIHIVKGACNKYGIKYMGDKITEEKLLAYLEKQKNEVQKQFNLGMQAGREEAMYEMEKEQKPEEWSEEDKRHLDRIKMVLESWDSSHTSLAGLPSTIHGDIDWLNSRLKSLRPQPHTVPVETATRFGNLEYERGVKDGIQSEKNRHWKPSEEQINALEYFIRIWGESGTMSPQNPTLCAAKTLLNDLKSL